jgi:uncharacterized membrane protein
VTAFTGYDWIKAFHIFLAVVWVGGAVLLNLLAVFALRSLLPGRKAEFAREAAWAGTRIFTPASFALLALGFWMIYDLDWGYPLWIVLGLAAFALSFLIGVAFLGPQSAKTARVIEQYGPDSPEATAQIRRVVTVARVDLVILVFAVFDMVLKPT